MIRKYFVPTLALLAITGMAMPAFSADDVSKTVSFAQQVTINGTQLKPGDYRVMVTGNDVKIEKGHKVMVETQAKVEQRSEKYPENQVVFDANGNVQEIRLGGHNEAIVFNGNGSMTHGQ
jgi:hypothetical protein